MNATPAPTVTISLTVKEASKALAFYTQAFGVEDVSRIAV